MSEKTQESRSELEACENETSHTGVNTCPDYVPEFDDADSSAPFDRAIQDITIVHAQLKRHSDRLKSWEEALKKREWITDQILRDSDIRINDEVERRFKRGKEQYEKEIKLLESQLKETTSENQRLQVSFNNIRESYNKTKQEKDELVETCAQLRKKNHALESRVKNLKKLIPGGERCEKTILDKNVELKKRNPPSGKLTNPSGSQKRHVAVQCAEKAEVKRNDIMKGPISVALKELLAWFCEVQLLPVLRLPYGKQSKHSDQRPSELRSECLDRCLQLLPRISELLHLHLNKLSSVYLGEALFCQSLKFLHFSFLLMDQNEGAKKKKVAASLHRVGETLHQEYLLPNCDVQPEPNSLKEDLRVCGSLVVLHTVSQVDILVHSWKGIKSTLTSPSGRRCFMKFCGDIFIISLMECKRHLFLSSQISRAVDVLLCMFIDSDSDESHEVRRNLNSFVFIKSICSLLSMKVGSADSAIGMEIKEKIIVLLQQALKRDTEDTLYQLINEQKLMTILQKELSVCLALTSDRVSSYECLLKSTLSLLSGTQTKGK